MARTSGPAVGKRPRACDARATGDFWRAARRGRLRSRHAQHARRGERPNRRRHPVRGRRRPDGPPFRFPDGGRASRDRPVPQHRPRARDIVADDVAVRAQGVFARRTVLSSGGMGFRRNALRERARHGHGVRARVPPSRDRSLLARPETDSRLDDVHVAPPGEPFSARSRPARAAFRHRRLALWRRLFRVAERHPDRQVRRGGGDRSPAAGVIGRRLHALPERRRSLLSVRGSDDAVPGQRRDRRGGRADRSSSTTSTRSSSTPRSRRRTSRRSASRRTSTARASDAATRARISRSRRPVRARTSSGSPTSCSTRSVPRRSTSRASWTRSRRISSASPRACSGT